MASPAVMTTTTSAHGPVKLADGLGTKLILTKVNVRLLARQNPLGAPCISLEVRVQR